MDINFSPSDQLKLQQLGVQAVILFGSQALGAAKIDRLVDIDIVFLDTAPAELLAHVAKHGIASSFFRPTKNRPYEHHQKIRFRGFWRSYSK